MTAPSLSKEDLLQLLRRHAGELDAVAEAADRLERDRRTSFESGSVPASNLLETMEIKLGIARRAGRPVRGGEELLENLRELGEAPIQLLFIEGPNRVWAVYLNLDLDEVAGCLVFDTQAGGSASPYGP
jgi:hypothetical protein